MDSHHEELMVIMKAGQEEMGANRNKLVAKMEACLEETKAYTTEACLEKTKTTIKARQEQMRA
jgi:hypothetical protein